MSTIKPLAWPQVVFVVTRTCYPGSVLMDMLNFGVGDHRRREKGKGLILGTCEEGIEGTCVSISLFSLVVWCSGWVFFVVVVHRLRYKPIRLLMVAPSLTVCSSWENLTVLLTHWEKGSLLENLHLPSPIC